MECRGMSLYMNTEWHEHHPTAFLGGDTLLSTTISLLSLKNTLYSNLLVLTDTLVKYQLISTSLNATQFAVNDECAWNKKSLFFVVVLFEITVLYNYHCFRAAVAFAFFLSTSINFNLLVFWTVHFQSSNIELYYCAIFINGSSCCV